MKHVWIHQRAGRPGYYVGWYENSHRRAKAFPKLEWAKRFQALKIAQINSDLQIFRAHELQMPWEVITEDYEQRKKTDGLSFKSIDDIKNTLSEFKRLTNIRFSTDLTQGVFDLFISARQADGTSKATVNKDLRNLKAFIGWAKSAKYITAEITLTALKIPKKPDPPLTGMQIKNLLIAAGKHRGWKERCLIALCTGLRRSDIETLTVASLDFESNSVHTASRKTGKAMSHRPLPKEIMPILTEYIQRLPVGSVSLWTDTFTGKKWKLIRNEAKLSGLKFHKLRKQFGSELAQSGASTALVSDLLEHASEQTTKDIYINLPNKGYRKAVKKLPVKKWI